MESVSLRFIGQLVAFISQVLHVSSRTHFEQSPGGEVPVGPLVLMWDPGSNREKKLLTKTFQRLTGTTCSPYFPPVGGGGRGLEKQAGPQRCQNIVACHHKDDWWHQTWLRADWTMTRGGRKQEKSQTLDSFFSPYLLLFNLCDGSSARCRMAGNR